MRQLTIPKPPPAGDVVERPRMTRIAIDLEADPPVPVVGFLSFKANPPLLITVSSTALFNEHLHVRPQSAVEVDGPAIADYHPIVSVQPGHCCTSHTVVYQHAKRLLARWDTVKVIIREMGLSSHSCLSASQVQNAAAWEYRQWMCRLGAGRDGGRDPEFFHAGGTVKVIISKVGL